MNIYLRKSENFYEETLDFYKKNFEITNRKEADIIVINDFGRIKTKKIVACNSTGIEHIKSPKIISLRDEELKDLTAVAELCLGMMIYLTRIFKKEEIKDKTLGIIGYGRIGKQFSIYAKGLGMNVLYHDKEKKRSLVSLDELLEKSDIVSIHVTADKTNIGFFKKKYFEKMKEGSILLNSARPWLVDHNLLKEALNNKLAGAWIDFELSFKHPKLITTPHLGGTTKESKIKSEMIIAKRLLKLKNEY
jgi:phosphoglycerate dehydrogenase-like enzyme